MFEGDRRFDLVVRLPEHLRTAIEAIRALWVAGEMPLLLKLGMPVVLIDQVYAELTSDPENYLKDREVKAFVEAHPKVFMIEETNFGKMAAALRAQGTFKTGQSLGEAAIADFF